MTYQYLRFSEMMLKQHSCYTVWLLYSVAKNNSRNHSEYYFRNIFLHSNFHFYRDRDHSCLFYQRKVITTLWVGGYDFAYKVIGEYLIANWKSIFLVSHI